VALVPWIASLRTVTGREAWRSGYCFGFLYGLGQLFWVYQLVARWVGNVAMGAIPWLIASALFAIYFGWTAVLIRHAWDRKWPWAIPLVWAGIEVFRSFIPTFAFPYGLIATPLWAYTALIQSAHFGSIYFVSAWVLLINTLLAMWMAGDSYLQTRRYISVALAVVAMSLVAMSLTTPTHPMVVTLGQPGVDMAFGTPEEQILALHDHLGPIVRRADQDGTQLLVLPEGIANVTQMPPHPVFPLPIHIPVIFGGERGMGPVYQSAFAFDGVRWQYVDKTRLVVFGEFVPGRNLVPWIVKGFRLPSGDLTPGTRGVRSVSLAGTTIGPIVCFEALFPDVAYLQARNDARLLTVIGIDDWFMDGTAPEQNRASSVWRAVETGLPLVRSTTLGYTMACDGKGQILAEAPLWLPWGLRVVVPVPDASPLFHALPVFPAVAGLFALGFPWMPRIRRKKMRTQSGEVRS